MTMMTLRLNNLQALLQRLRSDAQNRLDQANAEILNADGVRDLLLELRSARSILDGIPREPRIANLATEQWNYAGDIATDFAAIETQIGNTGDWIAQPAVTDVMWNGFAIDGVTWADTLPGYTLAQTTGLRTSLTNLIGALDTFLGNIES